MILRRTAEALWWGQSGADWELVGLDYTAVSRERKRLRDRIESDKRLKKGLREIEAFVLS
jgi:hypothetical protein